MCKNLIRMVLVLVLSLGAATYGIVIGDFEGDMDGWALWTAAPAGTTTSYSTTGASLNDNSLRVDVVVGGWQAVVYIPLHTEGLAGDFLANETISMDVTYDPADWAGTGNWANFELVVNSEDGGWVELGRPDTDTVNPGYTAGWDPTNFPTVQTRTVTWNYSDIAGDITADTAYLELVFVTNYDGDFTSGAYYLDNVRLTSAGAAGEPNLVGWWKLDEGSGTIAYDSSGNGIDGTINGDPAWGASSPYDQSPYLLFDGTNDWVDINSIPQGKFLLPNYTVSLWFRLDGGVTDERVMFAAVNDNDDHGIYISINRNNPGRLRYIHRYPFGPGGVGNEDTYSPQTGPFYNDGQWHHVAAVRESDTSRLLYADGVPVGSNTNGIAGFDEPTRILFGTVRLGWLARWWNGGIDDVRIYDSPLSLADIQMLIFTMLARMPSPASEGQEVGIDNLILSWKPGGFADTHDVYFGTDLDDVNDVNTANLASYPDVTYANVDVNGYTPGTLELDTTYYWRVDEVNDAHPTKLWKGAVWSFTTANYLVVDDMEFYGDSNLPGEKGSRIFYVWRDGFTVTNPYSIPSNGTASQVGHWPPPIMESEIVHAGRQSVPFYYLNDGTHSENPNVYYSQITAQASYLPIANNWTQKGVKALSLWFYGDTGNDANATEQMYVKLNGVKLNYDGDMNDIRQASWHEWNIDLAAFGIDLTNVTQIAIGFGDESNTTTPGGSGMVYFDDIRLYQPRCMLSNRTVDFAKADYAPAAYVSGDCAIDYRELEIMTRDWLVEDDVIATTQPGPIGLAGAYYPLDEGTGTTTADASGNDQNGTLEGGVTWVTPGILGNSAVDVNGAPGCRVSLGNWDPAWEGQLTISIWVKWSGLQHDYSQGLISKRDGWSVTEMRFMFEIDTPGNDSGLAFRQHSSTDTDVLSEGGEMGAFIGRWAHAAATFDGTTARIYLNGKEIASGPFTLADGTGAGMVIGNTNSSTWADCPESFNGQLDEARIYSRALSPAEIAYLADITPGDGQVYVPVPSPAELYDAELPGSRKIDLKDFAVLADYWLDEQLWPYF